MVTTPARLLDEVESFYNDHEKGGVVLARVDRMLVDHRLDDVVDLLRSVRDRVQTRGPFAIGLDLTAISRDAATAIRVVLVAEPGPRRARGDREPDPSSRPAPACRGAGGVQRRHACGRARRLAEAVVPSPSARR